jgi:uncharacterized protein (DUF302 family)
MLKRLICSLALVIAAAAFSPFATAEAANDGIVKFKSAYSMQETIDRMKKDIADKGIKFFDEIDQAKLAADAGITLLPSTLLVFGNPPLGTLFITADPDAGLDWPVRVLVYQDAKGDVWVPTPTSPGSRSATVSRVARRNSRWRRRSSPPLPRR